MPIKSNSILIVGGAGYIGSHMVLTLLESGYKPIVLDNLSKGHRESVMDAELIQGDIADLNLLDRVFAQYHFAAVMHFASNIEVGESIQYPAKYYKNNVAATLNLLDVMLKYNVKYLIYSSSAAVYGEPNYTPIDEAHPLSPLNPYGRTKWMVEEIIKDYAQSDGLNYAILRYFNAAGADPEKRLRENHDPESHLIPLVLQTALGQKESITIFGNDYSTIDGTCVRDYIHVCDLCDAHLLALKYLWSKKENIICNLGTGVGFSVKQVIDTALRITSHKITTIEGARRNGDAGILVADPSYAMQTLGWKPTKSELETMIRHAWQSLF